MKTVFVVNPKAGQGKNIDRLVECIEDAGRRLNAEIEIYQTKAIGDATDFVRNYCRINGATRFIACGGDGTLGEVVNGVIGCSGAEVGVIPIGTGNDFCRNFSICGDFTNIDAQINGDAMQCDAIFYRTVLRGQEKTGYCVNMFNIGFDCNVADMTAKMKQKPLISGSLAYLLSIFAILIKKKGARLSIEIDGKKEHSGSLLLTSIANGSYCGGGVKSNPLASVHSGNINVNIIYNISRLNFLSKLPFYMKGTHIKLRGIEKVINTIKCKKVAITPLDESMRLCIDGEIENAGKTEFEIVPNAFNFVMPAKTAIKEYV